MPKKQKKTAPKVLKVKDEKPSEKFNDIHPNLQAMPSLTLIIGSVRSGKSNLLVNYFCNPDFFKDKFDIVKFVSTTLHTDNKGKILSKHFDCMDHYEDSIIESLYNFRKKSFLILIILLKLRKKIIIPSMPNNSPKLYLFNNEL